VALNSELSKVQEINSKLKGVASTQSSPTEVVAIQNKLRDSEEKLKNT
jgi:hypothetical protein